MGSGENITINKIAKIIDYEVEYLPKRPGEAYETLADITKIKKVLSWNPKTKLENWISNYKF